MSELERLRAALAWYGNPDNYRRRVAGDDPESYRRKQPTAAVEDDRGQKAREALG